jgi:hypothetical protein
MKTCTPKTYKRIALALWPFKIYVVGAFLFYFLLRLFYPHPFITNIGNNTYIEDPAFEKLRGAFVLCAPILLLGAVIQFVAVDNKAGIRTIVFAVLPASVFAFFAFIWVISHLM